MGGMSENVIDRPKNFTNRTELQRLRIMMLASCLLETTGSRQRILLSAIETRDDENWIVIGGGDERKRKHTYY